MPGPVLGWIGFGEAAYWIAEGLRDEGLSDIYAYDAYQDDAALGPSIRQRAAKLEIGLQSSLRELIASSDVLINATNAKVAETVAREAKSCLQPRHLYVDLNSAAPVTKEKIAALVAESGASFVDAAVMDSVPPHKHRVPMFISGTGAARFLEFGARYGMNLTLIGEQAGGASALKMFRSVFMKGFTMLLLETLHASETYGVTPMILKSVEETLFRQPLEQTANLLLPRAAIHAERRVAEMDEVMKTLEALQIPSHMSRATKAKLQSLVDMGLKERLNNEAPGHFQDVLRALMGPQAPSEM